MYKEPNMKKAKNTHELLYGVISDYPHAVKFTATVSHNVDGKITETFPELLFLKPTHPCFQVQTNHISTGTSVFSKLISWANGLNVTYSTVDLDNYATKIHYLANS
jgi:hypothetical protein